MKTNARVALAALIGIVIGIGGAMVIHAQIKTPPGYVFAEVDVHDQATFQKYADGVPATLAPFGGHVIVGGGKLIMVEGTVPKRFVVIQFDSAAKAEAWESSKAYEAIKPLRHSSATSRVFIGEGVAP